MNALRRLLASLFGSAAPDAAELPTDDPFARLATGLAAPVTRQDERFGTLTLDRSVDLWEGRASWTGGAIDVQLSARSEDELVAALEVARALWNDQAGWSERIQGYAVDQLLPLKNDSWLDDDEEPLTPAQVPGAHAPGVHNSGTRRTFHLLAQRRRPVLGPHHPGRRKPAGRAHGRGHPGVRWGGGSAGGEQAAGIRPERINPPQLLRKAPRTAWGFTGKDRLLYPLGRWRGTPP